MRTISEILQVNARKWPDREALLAVRKGRDAALTFAGLEAEAEKFAARLSERGIRRGDPVLVFVPISLELYVALLGIFRIGATAVFLDPSSGPEHINACCARLPPRALIAITAMRWIRLITRGLRRIPLVFSPPVLGKAVSRPPASDHAEPDDAALITFTSGSTGEPKAAVRSHRFLIAQHEVLKNAIRLEPGERDLSTMPIFVLANLASGVTSILPNGRISHPGSVDAGRIAVQASRLRPTRTAGSPAFYQRLLMVPDSLRTFRKIYTGGAPVFPAVLQDLQRSAPDAEVVAVYGSTEAEPIAHIAAGEISAADWLAMRGGKGLLAGRIVPEIRLRIIPDQWGSLVERTAAVPKGEIGEILVTGAHVLKGYLGEVGDEETKHPMEGKIWHRTGDAGYLDDAGRLWLMGRCSARVEDADGVLYPFAVECVAMSFSFVRRAAFVPIGGNRLLAVELAPEAPESAREDIARAAAWTGVKEVRVLRAIPVDARHNAKVNYPKLLRLLGGNR